MDMLVKLYELPPLEPVLANLRQGGIEVRRVMAAEAHLVHDWVDQRFADAWASEVANSLARQPTTCFIAVRDQALLGFACYDATARGVFGPEGVEESERGNGLGKALLLACLHAMRHDGYAYGVIGWAGPQDFYHKVSGAVPIEDSTPGMYRGMLRRPR